MKKFLLISVAMFILGSSTTVFGWDGIDDNGSDITIEDGNLVREGEEIEYYDDSTGQYHTGDIETIDDSGYNTELEVYDNDTGEYRTFEMED
jgi:hypothetical protein